MSNTNPTSSFNEKLKESFDEVVNAAYRAGATGSHPNNANLHKTVDDAVNGIRELVLTEIVGDMSGWYFVPDKYEDEGLQEVYEHGAMDTMGQINAEQRNKILKGE